MGGFGQRYPTLAGVPPERQGLVQPPVSQEQVAEFYKALARARQHYGGQPPEWLIDNLVTRYFGESLQQAYGGGQKLFGRGRTLDERMQGAADIGYGGLKFAAPFAVPYGLATAPLTTMMGLGAGMTATEAAEAIGEQLHLGPGARHLAGLVAGGAVGGGVARETPEAFGSLTSGVPEVLGDLWRAYQESPLAEERGSISFKPTEPKTGETAEAAEPGEGFGAPLYRGTESRTAGREMRESPVGELGRGIYVTPHRWLAETYGGGPKASVKAGTREVHELGLRSPLQPHEVGFLHGGSRGDTDAVLRDGRGNELWRGRLSGKKADRERTAAMNQAARDAGLKAIVGQPDSIALNQAVILDPSVVGEPRRLSAEEVFRKPEVSLRQLAGLAPAEAEPQPGGLKPEEVVAKPGEVPAKLEEEPQPKAKLRDVKARTIEDLERRIPQEVRAVSANPTKTITGQPFHALDLEKPGEGFLPLVQRGAEQAEQAVQKAWDEAIQESEMEGGTAARKAVIETGARPPGASWWDKAFRLPLRNRYWYELSGESFTGKHIDVPKGLQPTVIDVVAGTSGGVKPLANAKRALGVLAEDLQDLPVMTDLRDPVSVRNALRRVGKALRTLKYRSFSGTMQFTSGLSAERPLSTNDVQVADIFGIEGEDIGKNPVLYEVLSRFFLKMRDMQNSHLPAGAQPWETWQMQAPAWVYNRLLKDPRSLPDDYSQVLPKIIQQLSAAGIPTPGGKITLETLMDPRMPDLMSTTRERFLATPIATAEMATKLTPQGQRAYETYKQLEQFDPDLPWVRNARRSYQQIQRNMMRALMARKGANKELGIPAEPSLLSQLMSVIVDRPVDVSRIDRMGLGTFEGEINPNMRIPMAGRAGQKWIMLDTVQREALLAMLGEDTQQAAEVASLFETVPHDANPKTYSVFLKRGVADEDAILRFRNQLSGFEVNASQVPNGLLLDINMQFPDEGEPFGPTFDQVRNAAEATFRGDPNVERIGYLARNYDSNYVPDRAKKTDAPNSLYKEKINAWKQARKSARRAVADQPGRGGRAGDTAQRAGDLARIRQKVRTHSRVRDVKSDKWHQTTQTRIKKHLAGGQP